MVEEYEVVPLTPLRKIEQRLERIEQGSPGYNAVLKDLAEMVKENQKVVDNLINTNSELIANVGCLSEKLGELTRKFDEFMDSIEVSETSEEPEEFKQMKEQNKKLEEMNQELSDRLKKLERKMKLAAFSKYYYQRPATTKEQPTESTTGY
jgi:uncharacterized coiled-coil protein SlyX